MCIFWTNFVKKVTGTVTTSFNIFCEVLKKTFKEALQLILHKFHNMAVFSSKYELCKNYALWNLTILNLSLKRILLDEPYSKYFQSWTSLSFSSACISIVNISAWLSARECNGHEIRQIWLKSNKSSFLIDTSLYFKYMLTYIYLALREKTLLLSCAWPFAWIILTTCFYISISIK